MKQDTMIAKACAESPEFGRYAEVMLESIPDLSMPLLRDLYKHNATPAEYFAHMERIRSAWLRRTPSTPRNHI